MKAGAVGDGLLGGKGSSEGWLAHQRVVGRHCAKHVGRLGFIWGVFRVRGEHISHMQIYLRISSFVALRDRDGLPGASSLPYFFLLLLLLLVVPLLVPFSELLSCSLVKELLRTLLLLV